MTDFDRSDESLTQSGDAEHTQERLWTPWRMRYVGGETKEAGCIFCNRLAADDDVQSLILYRSRHAFVIMNLYPYNTGHVMIVPNEHAASPERISRDTLLDMAELLPPLLRALRRRSRLRGLQRRDQRWRNCRRRCR